MNPADEEATKVAALLVPPALDTFGVAELGAYIMMLEAEIARVRAAIAAKQAHKAAAAGFFRTAPEQAGGA